MSRHEIKKAEDSKQLMETLSDNLHWQLRKQHMTQSRLASLLGLAPTTIQSYCAGRVMPSIYMLTRICRLLNVSPNKMLGWPEE